MQDKYQNRIRGTKLDRAYQENTEDSQAYHPSQQPMLFKTTHAHAASNFIKLQQ